LGGFLKEENAMPPRNRRKDRRAAGRNPAILRLESLENRRLLTGSVGNSGSAPVEILLEASVTDTASQTVIGDPGLPSSAVASPGVGEPSPPHATEPAASASPPPGQNLPVTSLPDAELIPTATAPSTGIGAASVPQAAAVPATAKPDLVPVRIEAPTNLDWDEPFVASGTIKNQGGAATTAAFKVEVLASAAAKGGPGSVPVGSFVVPAGLAPGASHEFEIEMRTPGRPPKSLTASPSYYLTLVSDAANAVSEINEQNNGNRGLQGVDAAVVTITPRLPSKLVAAGLEVDPGRHDWGGSLVVTATIRNEGPGKAPPTNARIVLAPLGEDPLGSKGYTIGSVPIPEIQPLQTASSTQEIRLPTYPPRALANVPRFTVMMISDAEGMADPVLKPIDAQGQGLDWTTTQITPKPTPVQPHELPDLAVSALATPSAIAWDQTIELRAVIENRGASASGPFRVRFALVPSRDPSGPSLVLRDIEVGSLAASATHEILESVKLPARVPSGLDAASPQGLVLVVIDPDRALDEARTDNNRLASTPIVLRLVSPDGSTTAPATTTTTAAPLPDSPGDPPVTPRATGQNPSSPAADPDPAPARRAISAKSRMALISERVAKAAEAQAKARAARRQRVIADAAHSERAPKLRIYPRNRQVPIVPQRLAKVHILPLRHPQHGDTIPDQSA
jgi:hypothetical protein